MFKAVYFTDLHIHDYKQFVGAEQRLQNCLAVLDYVYSYAEHQEADCILFGGDLFDRQQVLPTRVINATLERFLALEKAYPDLVFVAISGNHDHARDNSAAVGGEQLKYNSLSFLASACKNFKLIDSDTISINGVQIDGIPYFKNPADFKQVAEDVVPIYKKKILLIHQTPKGAVSDFIPSDVDPESEIFKEHNLVLCGHIHAKSVLVDTPEYKFIVGGSPIHRDMGDVGEEKGIYLIKETQEGFDATFKHLEAFPKIVYGNGRAQDWVVPKQELTFYSPSDTVADTQYADDLSPETLVRMYAKQEGLDEETTELGVYFVTRN